VPSSVDSEPTHAPRTSVVNKAHQTALNCGHLTSRWTFSKPSWSFLFNCWLSAFGVFCILFWFCAL